MALQGAYLRNRKPYTAAGVKAFKAQEYRKPSRDMVAAAKSLNDF